MTSIGPRLYTHSAGGSQDGSRSWSKYSGRAPWLARPYRSTLGLEGAWKKKMRGSSWGGSGGQLSCPESFPYHCSRSGFWWAALLLTCPSHPLFRRVLLDHLLFEYCFWTEFDFEFGFQPWKDGNYFWFSKILRFGYGTSKWCFLEISAGTESIAMKG